jgi:hypothetical protein
MWILPFRIFSRAVGSGCIKTLLREANSSSPDQGFTLLRTSVMSVVAASLRRHGMRTLLYVDDLLIACSSFEEASRARQILEDALLAEGIVRAPLKVCFDTPTQTLPDHLGFSISSIGKGALRVPERRCFALCRQARALLFEAANNRRLVDSDLLRRFSGATISCLPAVPLASFHLRECLGSRLPGSWLYWETRAKS